MSFILAIDGPRASRADSARLADFAGIAGARLAPGLLEHRQARGRRSAQRSRAAPKIGQAEAGDRFAQLRGQGREFRYRRGRRGGTFGGLRRYLAYDLHVLGNVAGRGRLLPRARGDVLYETRNLVG